MHLGSHRLFKNLGLSHPYGDLDGAPGFSVTQLWLLEAPAWSEPVDEDLRLSNNYRNKPWTQRCSSIYEQLNPNKHIINWK